MENFEIAGVAMQSTTIRKIYCRLYIICILVFSFSVLCFIRPRERQQTVTKRGVDHEKVIQAGEGIL